MFRHAQPDLFLVCNSVVQCPDFMPILGKVVVRRILTIRLWLLCPAELHMAQVKKDDLLFTVVAMKMEVMVRAPCDCTVLEICVEEDDEVRGV